MTITTQDIIDDARLAKKIDIETFFERFEQYLRAFIQNETSIHVEDAVFLNEVRRDFIESILNGEFKLG